MKVLTAALVLTAAVAATPPATARAELPELQTEDPCSEADAFDDDDAGEEARAARRRCRLARFEARQSARARADETTGRASQAQRWADTSLPYRATRPLSIDAFVGGGITSYGVSFNYLLVTPLELGVWFGGATSDYYSDRASIAYTRVAAALRLRWLVLPTNVTPIIGAGFGFTQAPLNAYVPDPGAGDWATRRVEGAGRAHLVSGEAGLQLWHKGFRVALEYIIAYAYYTQANELNDKNTENPELRLVWQKSLDQAIHGVRLEVGYAF